ncbi:MAG: PDZ domain-containing protein, partial [Planctomycetota bacterium]
QPLRRASGQEVRVGDVCFVFGSPFGIKFSMSQGTVSGLNRSQGASFMRLRSGYTNFIQTDAAMNPGNSGGPLINANGQVIGMNSAIANVAQASRNSEEFVGQSAGIGFAIPLETIENVVTQFVERRMPVVIRGYLGVNLQPASLTVRPSGDFEANGVYVTEVYPRSPADQGGVRAGDIIASANGQRIVDVAVLQSLVASLPPGQPVQLGVLRNGNEMTLEFNLGAAILDAFDNLNAIEGSESMTIDEIERIAREAIKPPRRR